MEKKIIFIREGGEPHDGHCVSLIEYGSGGVADALAAASCKGYADEIVLDNTLCLFRPAAALEQLRVIKQFLSNTGELIICDLSLSNYCAAVHDGYLPEPESQRALYGRAHIYDVGGTVDLLVDAGYTIKRKKVDRLSFIITAGV